MLTPLLSNLTLLSLLSVCITNRAPTYIPQQSSQEITRSEAFEILQRWWPTDHIDIRIGGKDVWDWSTDEKWGMKGRIYVGIWNNEGVFQWRGSGNTYQEALESAADHSYPPIRWDMLLEEWITNSGELDRFYKRIGKGR